MWFFFILTYTGTRKDGHAHDREYAHVHTFTPTLAFSLIKFINTAMPTQRHICINFYPLTNHHFIKRGKEFKG